MNVFWDDASLEVFLLLLLDEYRCWNIVSFKPIVSKIQTNVKLARKNVSYSYVAVWIGMPKNRQPQNCIDVRY